MRFLIINPNSTASMTDTILASARAGAPDLDIEAWTSLDGPRAIQGPQDGAAAIPPLLELIRRAVSFDAIIIACFDDTGLHLAKQATQVPVIGIGEAAYHAARLLGYRFSVVTTLAVSVPVIETNIASSGFKDICARVRASGVPVLDLEHNPEAAFRSIRSEAAKALAEDDISAIVLGCAGMAGLKDNLQDLQAELIDGTDAAIQLASAMASLRKVA